MAKRLDPKLRRRIADLSARGLSQKAIGEKLRAHRSTVFYHQAALGITAKRHGPRCPEPSEEQRREIFDLLRTGMGTRRIAARLGLTHHIVRKISEQAHFKHTRGPGQRNVLTDATRKRIVAAIMRHSDHALNLAQRFHQPYKTILKIATKRWPVRNSAADVARRSLRIFHKRKRSTHGGEHYYGAARRSPNWKVLAAIPDRRNSHSGHDASRARSESRVARSARILRERIAHRASRKNGCHSFRALGQLDSPRGRRKRRTN
jgi:DNA-binding CsgD family transcriptional regulator